MTYTTGSCEVVYIRMQFFLQKLIIFLWYILSSFRCERKFKKFIPTDQLGQRCSQGCFLQSTLIIVCVSLSLSQRLLQTLNGLAAASYDGHKPCLLCIQINRVSFEEVPLISDVYIDRVLFRHPTGGVFNQTRRESSMWVEIAIMMIISSINGTDDAFIE